MARQSVRCCFVTIIVLAAAAGGGACRRSAPDAPVAAHTAPGTLEVLSKPLDYYKLVTTLERSMKPRVALQ